MARDKSIEVLAYQRYLSKWAKEHVLTAEEKEKARVEYYKACEEGNLFESFAAYLVEYGYYGELFVPIKEFLNSKYLDKDYMKDLLPEDDLYQMYLREVA